MKTRKRLQRRTPIRKVRPTLRRGEPTMQEKEAARVIAFSRAKGMCQLKRPGCLGYAPLKDIDDLGHQGQLAHAHGKRRFGWMESDETGQAWAWSCWVCHRNQHQYGNLAAERTDAE